MSAPPHVDHDQKGAPMAAATGPDPTPAPAASLVAEYAELQTKLSDPTIHTDQALARRLGRRYAELTPIVNTVTALDTVRGDLAAAIELSADDDSFADEISSLTAQVQELESKLAGLLTPRDPDDAKDAIIEIKAGEGGEESALFAGDLLRMYLRYAERHGWKTEVISTSESDLGGR